MRYANTLILCTHLHQHAEYAQENCKFKNIQINLYHITTNPPNMPIYNHICPHIPKYMYTIYPRTCRICPYAHIHPNICRRNIRQPAEYAQVNSRNLNLAESWRQPGQVFEQWCEMDLFLLHFKATILQKKRENIKQL